MTSRVKIVKVFLKPYLVDQAYCRFYPASLVNQITDIGKEMCV